MELEHALLYFFLIFANLITLFLYGIGAYNRTIITTKITLLHYSYMELEHNNCNIIIPIVYYIIPIWNWSSFKYAAFSPTPLITLFLYGIGASKVICNVITYMQITLFLYGIGASQLNLHCLNTS